MGLTVLGSYFELPIGTIGRGVNSRRDGFYDIPYLVIRPATREEYEQAKLDEGKQPRPLSECLGASYYLVSVD